MVTAFSVRVIRRWHNRNAASSREYRPALLWHTLVAISKIEETKKWVFPVAVNVFKNKETNMKQLAFVLVGMLGLIFINFGCSKSTASQTGKLNASTPLTTVPSPTPELASEPTRVVSPELTKKMSKEIRGFSSKDPGVRWKALARISTYEQDAVPLLIEAIQNANPDVRWCAAGSLALIGPKAKAALPNLLEVSSGDVNDAVKEMAQLAANEIGGDKTAPRPAKVRLITSVSPGGVSMSITSGMMLDRLRAEIDQPDKKEQK
jgi:hypothetical protein